MGMCEYQYVSPHIDNCVHKIIIIDVNQRFFYFESDRRMVA